MINKTDGGEIKMGYILKKNGRVVKYAGKPIVWKTKASAILSNKLVRNISKPRKGTRFSIQAIKEY